MVGPSRCAHPSGKGGGIVNITATGILRHCWWGEYQAGIGLQFQSAEDAALALGKLPGWKTSTAPTVLLITVDSAQLEQVKVQLGALGADVDKIDSVAKSIDHGEPFEITVRVEDPRQVQMFE
jgi:hypothetical protein